MQILLAIAGDQIPWTLTIQEYLSLSDKDIPKYLMMTMDTKCNSTSLLGVPDMDSAQTLQVIRSRNAPFLPP